MAWGSDMRFFSHFYSIVSISFVNSEPVEDNFWKQGKTKIGVLMGN
jgi:hypothetical protein